MAVHNLRDPATGEVVEQAGTQAGAAHVLTGYPSAVALLAGATAIGPGAGMPLRGGMKSFSATVTGSGAVAATVQIEISNDGVHWRAMVDAVGNVAEIVLSGTDSATDGFITDESWLFHRANVTGISGTNAAVTVIGA